MVFVLLAALPRLGHRLRWPTRLGPRGLAAWIAFNTLSLFAIRNRLVPAMQRIVDRRERAEALLRESLGREPTEDEVLERIGALSLG